MKPKHIWRKLMSPMLSPYRACKFESLFGIWLRILHVQSVCRLSGRYRRSRGPWNFTIVSLGIGSSKRPWLKALLADNRDFFSHLTVSRLSKSRLARRTRGQLTRIHGRLGASGNYPRQNQPRGRANERPWSNRKKPVERWHLSPCYPVGLNRGPVYYLCNGFASIVPFCQMVRLVYERGGANRPFNCLLLQ